MLEVKGNLGAAQRMGEGKLNTAVLGLDDAGKLMLEAASQVEHFDVEAVADTDSQLAQQTAEQHGCRAYDDYRQLIAQNRFDCLLVAAPTHSCDEHVRAAIKRKSNVFKLAPPARNFEEAVEFHRLSEAEGTKFAVANPWRFAETFGALRECLEQGRVEHIFLVTIRGEFPIESHAAWRSDPKLAGGGVLLHSCFGLLDQLIWNFGVPAQVYSLNVNTAGDRQQRLYRTEDAALVAMRFSDSFIAHLTASPAVGAGSDPGLIEVIGKDKILTVSAESFRVSDPDHGAVEQSGCARDERGWMKGALESFALSVLWPDKNPLISSLAESLKNMAVIEAAYLSGRTGMPEEPVRVLRMVSRESTFIWPG
jgi:predicted dehydrogenase